MNSVHRMHDPDSWRDVRHLLLAFHDETVEALVRGYRVERLRMAFDDALQLAKDRVMAGWEE